MNKRLVAFLSILSLSLSLPFIPANAAAKAGGACSKLNTTSITGSKKFTCIKSGKKLVWNKGTQIAKTSLESKYSAYELTKLKAYNNIREGADKGNLENISLVYHVSKYFPKDLLKLYKTQVEYSSKLYGSFFKKKEVMNIYLYTEKDEDFLYSKKLFTQGMSDFVPWFEAWRNGKDQQHNLGLVAQYAE